MSSLRLVLRLMSFFDVSVTKSSTSPSHPDRDLLAHMEYSAIFLQHKNFHQSVDILHGTIMDGIVNNTLTNGQLSIQNLKYKELKLFEIHYCLKPQKITQYLNNIS